MSNEPISNQQSKRYKVCEFFEKHKALCITTGILFLPLGIAYATTYGVAKRLADRKTITENFEINSMRNLSEQDIAIKFFKYTSRNNYSACNIASIFKYNNTYNVFKFLFKNRDNPYINDILRQKNCPPIYTYVKTLMDKTLVEYVLSPSAIIQNRLTNKAKQLPNDYISMLSYKTALTCFMLTDSELELIISDKKMPQNYREVAYCVGTMRKMLAQCKSDELFDALKKQESNILTLTTNQQTIDQTFLNQFLQTEQALKQELINQYNECWSSNAFLTKYLLPYMIEAELRTNPEKSKFYQENQDTIDSCIANMPVLRFSK